jgi:hypothetical protein
MPVKVGLMILRHTNLHSMKRKELAPADDVPGAKDPEHLEDKEGMLMTSSL